MASKLISQALKWSSRAVIQAETGISPYRQRKLERGEYSRAQAQELNAKIRAFKDDTTYQLASRTHTRAREVTPLIQRPPVLRTAEVLPRVKRETVDQVKQAFPRYSRNEIEGLLEVDQVTRERLAGSLAKYHDAKERARKAYRQDHKRGESLEDYTKRKTKKEFKQLSDDFERRRKVESHKHFSKLMTKGYVDLSIENYGRRRGQWHSVKRLSRSTGKR